MQKDFFIGSIEALQKHAENTIVWKLKQTTRKISECIFRIRTRLFENLGSCNV